MYNPQVTSTKNDIEQGGKDAYQSNTGTAVVSQNVASRPTASHNANVGVMICCCNTRDASAFWFAFSLILEAIAFIGSITGGMLTVYSLILNIAYIILSIQGLVGCVKMNRNLVNAGRVGYIIKAVLQAIGIIILIAIWDSIDSSGAFDSIDIDVEKFLTTVMIISVVYFIFTVAGAVVAGKFINEIDIGIFGNIET
ncbi:predicted protein [Chaetoceros tenuissimus]|uniref:Uncharacterized protein n=1 Tax=Chaetoceros tenuissimus TaxID=426638 RepID=A0AAD3CE08_9STRA|nr:predicted protein [Chaetoceros tenuissimus]